MSEPGGISALIKRASKEWRSSLIDVGGNNRLLNYRPNASTLDLGSASTRAITRLLNGELLGINELFDKPSEIEKAKKACASLARKQREALEEFGVPVAFLASGLATWDPEGTKQLASALEVELENEETEQNRAKPKYTRPNAPVLLRPVELVRKRGAQDSWTIQLVDDFQLNAVLHHVLNADVKRLTPDEVQELDDNTLDSMQEMLKFVADACDDIKDFEIKDEFLLGAFSYQKQPMVADIDDLEALSQSPLVAALAGEEDAIVSIRHQSGEFDDATPDYVPVDSEFLVLDADSSQSFVVNAALAGRNLVVEGPPGTGKSQTIANVIAALVASNKDVLFVAQKRAAVSAVLGRLESVGLGDIVMDAFAATGSRRYVAEELSNALASQQKAGIPNVSQLQYELEDARDTLVSHKDALSKDKYGWGLSALDLWMKKLEIPAESHVDFRLKAKTFESWQETDVERHADEVVELASLGALSETWTTGEGWSPRAIKNNASLTAVNDLLISLQNEYLRKGMDELSRLAEKLESEVPVNWEDVTTLLDSLDKAATVNEAMPALIDNSQDLEKVSLYLSAFDRAHRASQEKKITWLEKRRVIKKLREWAPELPQKAKLENIRLAYELWAGAGSTGIQLPPKGYEKAKTAINRLKVSLGDLQEYLQGIDLEELSFAELRAFLVDLSKDNSRSRMPRAAKLRKKLKDAGLIPVVKLIEELTQDSDAREFDPGEVLKWVVFSSILDDAVASSPELSSVDGDQLETAAEKFQRSDVEHLKANAARIRRKFAEKLKYILDNFPEEHQILKTEVTRKRKFRTIRSLISEAPNVMLAVKPVWAMSPLQVSKLLPAHRVFDVVIFDEASQIVPADAIPALIRANQVIVAGDSRQLPPTEFFTKILEDEPGSDEEEISRLVTEENADLGTVVESRAKPLRKDSFTRDAESILFAFDRVLAGQSRRLLWHYRSKDERLIAVSNAHVYDSSLTTFPAADSGDAIQYVSVPPSPGVNGKTNSPEKEVEKVVQLVREHFKNSPDESLGVITFGSPHQRRIEMALDKAMQKDPAFADWISSGNADAFFVKNIERVQGDERDAIILSVGYGKEPDGKLKLFWGPLLKDGGERRLNVAISRAKKRITLVTSFSPDDVAEDAHESAGFRLIYRFLRFMASGGVELTGGVDLNQPLNPFEIDVRDRLERAGLQLDPQFGVGSYRLDFAVRHPKYPGAHVLAIEADGASYHSGHTARERDRLRQSLLEQRGWVFHRIWSTDWFNDADSEVKKVLESYKDSVKRFEHGNKAKERIQESNPSWHVESLERKELPNFPKGLPITEYPQHLLISIILAIRSDGVLRSNDEELDELVKILGYSKKGSRIVATLKRIQSIADRT